jgi:hypothetical protein
LATNCPHCGSATRKGARFCRSCGAPVETEESKVASTPRARRTKGGPSTPARKGWSQWSTRRRIALLASCLIVGGGVGGLVALLASSGNPTSPPKATPDAPIASVDTAIGTAPPQQGMSASGGTATSFFLVDPTGQHLSEPSRIDFGGSGPGGQFVDGAGTYHYNDCNPDCATAANTGATTLSVQVLIPIAQTETCPDGSQYMLMSVNAVDAAGTQVLGRSGMSFSSPACDGPLALGPSADY